MLCQYLGAKHTLGNIKTYGIVHALQGMENCEDVQTLVQIFSFDKDQLQHIFVGNAN